MRDRAAPDRARPALRGGAADRPRRGPDRPGQPAARADRRRDYRPRRDDAARRGPHPTCAALRVGQDGHRRVRARASPRSTSSSSRPAARRRRSRPRASRCASIEDFTGFPEIMDGRVKTLHPKLYAGPARPPRRPGPHGRGRGARDRVRRPRVREPLPVRGDRGAPRRHRRRGDREHRHRRPDDDPGGGEELPVRRRRRQARELRRDPPGARRPRRARSRSARARASPPRRSPAPRATTRRSRAGSPSSSTTSRP